MFSVILFASLELTSAVKVLKVLIFNIIMKIINTALAIVRAYDLVVPFGLYCYFVIRVFPGNAVL